MFMSTVAPVGEKSQKEQDLDFRNTSESEEDMRNLDCGIRKSGFFETMKYPILLLNMCGIYVPSYCICERETYPKGRNKTESQDSCDSDSNDANVKSLMYVKCVNGRCNEGHTKRTMCPNADKYWVALVKKIACIVLIVIHCTNSVRYIFILKDAILHNKSIVFSLTVYFTLAGYFYLMACNSHACLKHFTPFISAVVKYDERYIFHCNFKKLSRINCIIFWIAMVIQLAQSVIVTYGVLTFFDGMNDQMWPFAELKGVWRLLGALFIGGGVFFAACNLYGTNFLRATVTVMLQSEFQSLDIELTTILTNAGENHCIESAFDQFLEKLRAVSDLMNKGYHLTKHTIAACYVFGMPMICLMLYGIINGSIHVDQYMVLTMSVFVVSLMMVHTTWTLAKLKSQATSLCDIVYLCDWSTYSPQLLQKLVLFTNMFCTKSFGMSMYGMFSVDWSTLLTIGGTLLTYGIVVIQFQIGTPAPVCHFGNLTNN